MKNMDQRFNLITMGAHLVIQDSMRENDRFGRYAMMSTLPNKKLDFRRYL